jgi:hypothetical protein
MRVFENYPNMPMMGFIWQAVMKLGFWKFKVKGAVLYDVLLNADEGVERWT